MFIFACRRLADLGGVHFFTLNSCKFNIGPARRVLHCVQRPLMYQGLRNNVIDQDFYLPFSLEDKLPLSLQSVVVCCQSSSFLCYCRLFLLVFCAIFLIFREEMHLFILLLSMIVMSHQHRYSIRFELRHNILVHVCISQLSESTEIFGCVHVLESELKVDITSCRNEDKSSRMRFKCMLDDHYHCSLYKEYRNRYFRKISLVSENCTIYPKTPGKSRQSSEPGRK